MMFHQIHQQEDINNATTKRHTFLGKYAGKDCNKKILYVLIWA